MSTTTARRSIWIAYGRNGVVGAIARDDDGCTVTMAGADAPAGTYPTMEIAKNALHARMSPGSDRPRFVEH